MFNWLSTFVSRRGTAPRPASEVLPVEQSYHAPVSQPHLRVYQQSPWVYVAINRLAEAAALVPLHVYRLEEERRVEMLNHPLERLLDAPNPYTSRFELLEQTIGFLELTGNAYWFLSGGEDGIPTEIWALRPDRLTIVPGSVSGVRGYVYEVDGQRVPLLPDEIVHFKRWHPGSDFYGLSALEAAQFAVQSDKAMAEWNRNTFGQDNGVPAGIVSIKGTVSDADFERLKREWRTSYGGTQRRTAFLRGGEVEWRGIGLSHTELDFLQGRKAHRDEILNIFGIPVGLVSENATEANARVAERMFIERTLYPKLVRLAQKITQELLPFWSGDCLAEFEDIRPTDIEARLEEIKTAYTVLSINEIRERFYRLPPVPWGELPVNYPQVGATHESPDLNTQPEPNDAPPDTDASSDAVVASSETAKSAGEDAVTELTRWERFSLKRLGRPNARPFLCRAVPDELAFEVTAELQTAQTEAEIKWVFEAARHRVHTGGV